MLTLGIDLSSQERDTAACVVEWIDGEMARVLRWLDPPIDDTALLSEMPDDRWVAIDAPFGWPTAFIEAVQTWQHSPWPIVAHEAVRFRVTDLVVKKADKENHPLSVSSERLAATARRAAELLTKHHGSSRRRIEKVKGPIIETYPVAALRRWKLITGHYSSYKGNQQHCVKNRKNLVQRLQRAAPWLDLRCHSSRALCQQSDHNLDALVCALVARAAYLDLTPLPNAMLTPAQRPKTVTEGWIHLPEEGSLPRLPLPRLR